MDDLQLLRRAVEENPLEDAPLAALVDALIEADAGWEAEVRQAELALRRLRPDKIALIRQTTTILMALGPECAVRVLEMGKQQIDRWED